MRLLMKCRDADMRAFYEKQSHQYSDDSGFDIFCPDNVEIYQGIPKLVDLGIQCYSPDKKAYMLMPRSSLWKKNGLILLNSIGLIDKQYTGTIKAPLGFFNAQPNAELVWVFIVLTWLLLMFTATFVSIPWIGITINILGILVFATYFVTKSCPCHVRRGEALFQLVAFDGERINVELVDELPETERGERGFGSTTENSTDVIKRFFNSTKAKTL